MNPAIPDHARPVRPSLLLSLAMGVFLMWLGTVVGFVPGAERVWYAFAGVFLLAGLFIPRRDFRAATIVLIAICVVAAIAGHRRGLEYREKLQQRGDPASRPISLQR